jgi:hypothetical protein
MSAALGALSEEQAGTDPGLAGQPAAAPDCEQRPAQ